MSQVAVTRRGWGPGEVIARGSPRSTAGPASVKSFDFLREGKGAASSQKLPRFLADHDVKLIRYGTKQAGFSGTTDR
jgi:RNA 3'-terminal phosphate cyclase